MNEILLAIGLVLAIEGVVYAIAPQTMKTMIVRLLAMPAETLRLGGVVALAAGVAIVWLARSGSV